MRYYRQKRTKRKRRFLIAIVAVSAMFGITILVRSVFGNLIATSMPNQQQPEISSELMKPEASEEKDNSSADQSDHEISKSETVSTYDYTKQVPASTMVNTSYFDDAVFIGDSRTEGLILNTGLSNTMAYTHKGLMVDTVFTKPVINKNGSKLSVMDALKTTSFKKVYIMLGINETGWPYNSVFIKKYGEVIDGIKEINPTALIYVQEILPVSASVSSTHGYVKNSKISEFNALIKDMATEKQIYYVDTAAAVASDDGNLPEDAATDGIHLKKEYCEKWLDYLKSHTVLK